MKPQDHLRQSIEREQQRLRAGVPPDRAAAIGALLRVQDRLSHSPAGDPTPDLVTGRRLASPGLNKALQLILESTGDDAATATLSGSARDSWAERFLAACDRLAEAELVLTHSESGFMRLVAADETLHAWIATKQTPPTWRERADIAWWATWLAGRHEAELHALQSSRPGKDGDSPGPCPYFRQLAGVYLRMMSYQLGYPPDAVIGGCTVQTYLDVLGWLIAWTVQAHNLGQAVVPQSEGDLTAAIAADLAVDPVRVARAISAFTLNHESAAYHAAVPGVASAPLVRVDPGQLVWSVPGMTTEPLFFLTRELKRRDAQAYHNTAHLRETVFRQDLYALCADKRFVTSAGSIELRRERGDVRTDIDAVVFDRKSGTLGLFELKSQDPFARSTAELARQRDNVLFANRQVSRALTWLQRHGADALLSRVDNRTARTFRVQKVYPFVLGRYLAHFGDGPRPDRRAAWGTWPQILRLRDGQPFRATEANPLASLFTRLTTDAPTMLPPTATAPQEITLGDLRLIVHASYAAFQREAARREGGEAASLP